MCIQQLYLCWLHLIQSQRFPVFLVIVLKHFFSTWRAHQKAHHSYQPPNHRAPAIPLCPPSLEGNEWQTPWRSRCHKPEYFFSSKSHGTLYCPNLQVTRSFPTQIYASVEFLYKIQGVTSWDDENTGHVDRIVKKGLQVCPMLSSCIGHSILTGKDSLMLLSYAFLMQTVS